MAKILVVDDSRFSRRMVTDALRQGGYELVEATNGREGFEAFQTQAFDCVVSDLLMPVMNGLEMLREIRSTGSTIPIVMCSADVQESSKQACFEQGIVGFCQKPFKAEELLAFVAQALSQGNTLPSSTNSQLQGISS